MLTTTPAPAPAPLSQPAATRSGPAALPQRVLVFHVGSLGDTLVALPSFWAVRDAFPQARRVMLTKTAARGSIPVGREILEGSGLFDDYLLFDGDYHAYGNNPPRWRKWLGALALIRQLRAARFDLVVYLAPSVREPAQIERDLLFFRLAGIRQVIGARALGEHDAAAHVPEAQRLLSRLAGSTVPTPPLQRARRDLSLAAADRSAVARWLADRPAVPANVGPWVAFAPGSNLSLASSSGQVSANSEQTFGLRPLRVSYRKPASSNSRLTLCSVASLRQPRGCMVFQARDRSPLLSPRYCAATSINSLIACGDSAMNSGEFSTE